MNSAINIFGIHSADSNLEVGQRERFFLVSACFILCCALFAAFSPIWLSIVSLFLFAGPHNFVELRYFLSRCPARLPKLKAYFGISFIGGPLLAIVYSLMALGTVLHLWHLPAEVHTLWNVSFLGWLAILACLTGWTLNDKLAFCSAAVALICLSVLMPNLLLISLVYVHPIIGMWILDREIKLCRPALLKSYRMQLGIVLLAVLTLSAVFWQSAPLQSDNPLTVRIIQETGARAVDFLSSRLMLTVHIFLEMLHYGVWLLAIPAITLSSRRWEMRTIPLTHRFKNFKWLVLAALGLAGVAAMALWGFFLLDYKTTRDIYFSVAILHVIMEFPFLMKSFQGAR